MAWLAVPMESPCAIGLLIRPASITLKPSTAPNKPTKITTAADNEGIPPVAADTSMAIGVVTDLGANEQITSGDAPIPLAIKMTDTKPTRHPTNWESKMGNNCFLIISNCK